MTSDPSMETNLLQDTDKKMSWSKFLRSAKFQQTFITSMWGFLTATERAIILPTLWLYLKLSWSEPIAHEYYAVTMAAFSLSIIFSSPVCGYFADRGVSTKILIVVSNQLEIIGNLVYLFAPHPSLVLLGRLVAGMGGGCEPALYADLTKLTSVKERTPYIVVSMLARQFGLIFGPVFTIIMSQMTFTHGKIVISVYNGPGLIMAICWTIHTIVSIFFYPDMDKANKKKLDAKDVAQSKKPLCICCSSSNDDEDSSEISEISRSFTEIIHPYKKYSVTCVLLMSFGSYFSLMCVETLLSPFMDYHFQFKEVQTSYIYLGASILVILMFIVLHQMTKRYSDWTILVVGGVSLSCSYLFLTISTFLTPMMTRIIGLTLIIFATVFHIIGETLTISCSDSLYTKLIPLPETNRAQTLFRTVDNVACLAGLLAGGGMWFVAPFAFTINFFLALVPTVMLLLYPEEFYISNSDELNKQSIDEMQEK